MSELPRTFKWQLHRIFYRAWISRFIDISSTISAEELQYLWGKILAGEIKRPGSFSLRTLDVLRNLSQKEAECFVKLGNYIIRSDGKAFYIDPKLFIFTKRNEITFFDILGLKDAGLIFATDLEFSFNSLTAGKTSTLLYGPIALIFEREKDTPKLANNVGVLTRVGMELLQLLTIQPNMEYVEFTATRFHADGMKFAWAPIHQILEDKIEIGMKTYMEI